MAAALSPPPAMEQVPPPDSKGEETPKFTKGQRVFAKDENCGLLYEAVIRRAVFGVDRQVQTEDKEEEWHCFVHYLGWNVKWDRWVSEGAIYEMTDKNRELANSLQKAVNDAKKKHGRKSPHVMTELTQTMKRLEQERRLEERREELAKQGIVMQEQDKQNGMQVEETSSKQTTKFTKAYFTKELALREQDLQGKRKQLHAEKLVLPFSLKKVLVEDYEIVSQCGMVPTLPAKEGTTVQEVLDDYLATKTATPVDGDCKNESSGGTLPRNSDGIDPKEAADCSSKAAKDASARESNEQGELVTKQEQEWRDMVDGVALLFDQAIGAHLLYRQELSNHEWIEQQEEYHQRRHSQVYGCEHLLRLFVRLPTLLSDQLSDTEARPIYSKLGDLIRYLQKHQSKIFLQSYHTPTRVEEPSRKRVSNGTTKQSTKRKRTASSKNETAPQDDLTAIAKEALPRSDDHACDAPASAANSN